jgi:hypothetical protein
MLYIAHDRNKALIDDDHIINATPERVSRSKLAKWATYEPLQDSDLGKPRIALSFSLIPMPRMK